MINWFSNIFPEKQKINEFENYPQKTRSFYPISFQNQKNYVLFLKNKVLCYQIENFYLYYKNITENVYTNNVWKI
jgi:predicted glycosyltransferase involved in capsule biosynthesis